MSKKNNERNLDKALRVYLPPELCEQVGLKQYSHVRFTVKDGRMILTPLAVVNLADRARDRSREYALAGIRQLNAADLPEVQKALGQRAMELANHYVS